MGAAHGVSTYYYAILNACFLPVLCIDRVLGADVAAFLQQAPVALSRCPDVRTPTPTHQLYCAHPRLHRSTSVGVTVNPVRVDRIEAFGTLDLVGQRLLEAERKKVRKASGWRAGHV